MDLTLGASLVVLALIDSTSFGTLLIPIWLLLSPGRVRLGRMAVYLGTVVLFYLGVGLLVTIGAGQYLDAVGRALETRAAAWVQLVAGVGLFVLSFAMDSKKARARRAAQPGGGRLGRWRDRALAAEGGPADGVPVERGPGTTVRTRSGGLAALIALALGAVSLEVATMVPYLAAIGLITTSGLPTAGMAGVLAGYCLVMVLPATVLIGLRLVAGRAVEPVLTRFSDWMGRNAATTTAWVVGIVGFLLARDAAFRLGWLDSLVG